MKKESELESKSKKMIVFLKSNNIILNGEVKQIKQGTKMEVENNIAKKLILNKIATEYKEEKAKLIPEEEKSNDRDR